jgi:hypothetical protein
VQNDGNTIYRLRVGEVPVDGFWSVTVYNSAGYLQPNSDNIYSVSSVTAQKDPFGGCADKIRNCLPIMQGWNYTVRLFRPRAEVIDGT